MIELTIQHRLDGFADLLDASGEYRVLRKLQPFVADGEPPVGETWSGIIVDVETTGLDPAMDAILELAMLPFRFDATGRICEAGEGWEGLRQPAGPIPREVSAIHGLTDEKVAGLSIDPDEVARFIVSADLIVAHNAAFDRPFLERFCPAFAARAFGCSMTEIDWIGEGHEGLKLGYLAADHGFFHDRHRALDDCRATLELLSRPLRTSGVLALAALLERTHAPVWRIWAESAPFAAKDALKRRGYRWCGGGPERTRAWYIDVVEENRGAELDYLEREIFGEPRPLIQQRLGARDRFSVRALP